MIYDLWFIIYYFIYFMFPTPSAELVWLAGIESPQHPRKSQVNSIFFPTFGTIHKPNPVCILVQGSPKARAWLRPHLPQGKHLVR